MLFKLCGKSVLTQMTGDGFSRSMVIESEWDDLSNELQSDYQDYDQYEEAEWVLNSRIYTDSHIDRWS
jgi:hypothetical protein